MAFIIFYFFFLKKVEKVEKTVFFRANSQISNLNVLHKGLLLQDWVFRLGVLLFCYKHCEQCHCLSLARDSSIDLKSLVHEQKIPSITTLLYDLCGAQAV